MLRTELLDNMEQEKPSYWHDLWHDLIKDPTDLPEIMGEYPCITDDGKIFSKCYKTIDGIVRFDTMNKVIAWYDLPKFEY